MELVRAITRSIGHALGSKTEIENYVATGIVYELILQGVLRGDNKGVALVATSGLGILLYFIQRDYHDNDNSSHNDSVQAYESNYPNGFENL